MRSVRQDTARCESTAVLPVGAFKTANRKQTDEDTGCQALRRPSENSTVSVKVASCMGCMYDIWRFFRTSSRRPDINTEQWPFIKLANRLWLHLPPSFAQPRPTSTAQCIK